jgi:hypothetical protein
VAGSSWRGRRFDWNPDRHLIEQERQRWIMQQIADENAIISELTVDPDRAYEVHREAFMETGDPDQLRMMLQYVR